MRTLINIQIVLAILFFSIYLASCTTPYGTGSLDRKGRSNYFLKVATPFTPSRIQRVYNHSVAKSHRAKSDCQPNCPQVDDWQYLYKPKGRDLIVDSKPISTRKEFWKNKNEARIISMSLFGDKPVYLNGFLDGLDSFQFLNNVNHISEPLWGYENFTIRIYTPKRSPKNFAKLGKLKGELPNAFVQQILNLGVEVVYVDNEEESASLDATFWRFLVLAENMPKGQTLRYLVRDVDSILTGGELHSVGEWIASGFQFHRMNTNLVCISPVTASVFAGKHTGPNHHFKKIRDFLATFPYRYEYGDDELFIREILWPRMKSSGSVLTHYNLTGWRAFIGNPYAGSCEQPTQAYCDAIKKGGTCKDVQLTKNAVFPAVEIGLRYDYSYFKAHPEFFKVNFKTKEGPAIFKALSVNGR